MKDEAFKDAYEAECREEINVTKKLIGEVKKMIEEEEKAQRDQQREIEGLWKEVFEKMEAQGILARA